MVSFHLIILTLQVPNDYIGNKMAGVSGCEQDGTYSIVVSGMYQDLDRDEGDTLYYSGPGSHENTSWERFPRCRPLERSLQSRRPVRVFRSSKGKWRHSPQAGVRYDGLYVVMAVSLEKNSSGGRYQRFKLVRRSDQEPIKTSEPTRDLLRLFERVQQGYTRLRLRQVPA